jgi:fumarylacetoacetate (FAA) hydrolase
MARFRRTGESTAKVLMKLATYKDGSRDGQLVVVSRDLTTAHYATGIASRLQQALDDWNFFSPQLQDLYETLNGGKARHAFAFDPAQCMAPLPRAYQRLDALTGEDGGALKTCHCASDALLGACSPIPAAAQDLCAGLAVITGDVPPGATPEQGQDAIWFITLANTLHLHTDEAGDASMAALGPVAVTPDEIGAAWQDGRVHLTLSVAVNNRKLGLIEAGEMRWSFGQIIAAAARLRPLAAGSMVGSGVIRNGDSARGFVRLAHKREAEAAQAGQPHTPWLRAGDSVRIEMKGRDGQSVFGAIEQTVQETVAR